MLALEIYEKLNREGVLASLLTGQERQEVPMATHISCTVEMVNVNKVYDVAVIDEIQMIGDPERGSAWSVELLISVPEIYYILITSDLLHTHHQRFITYSASVCCLLLSLS